MFNLRKTGKKNFNEQLEDLKDLKLQYEDLKEIHTDLRDSIFDFLKTCADYFNPLTIDIYKLQVSVADEEKANVFITNCLRSCPRRVCASFFEIAFNQLSSLLREGLKFFIDFTQRIKVI